LLQWFIKMTEKNIEMLARFGEAILLNNISNNLASADKLLQSQGIQKKDEVIKYLKEAEKNYEMLSEWIGRSERYEMLINGIKNRLLY